MMMIAVHPPHRCPTNVRQLNARLCATRGVSTEWCFYTRRDVALHRLQTPSHVARDPVHTAAMATKFTLNFLQAVDEQTVMSGMGEELESAPTGGSRRESCKDPVRTAPPQPGGFHDLLNSEFPAMPDLDATVVRIWGFLEQGAPQADAARREFEKELHTF
jgi:hypothetical protein